MGEGWEYHAEEVDDEAGMLRRRVDNVMKGACRWATIYFFIQGDVPVRPRSDTSQLQKQY